MALTLIAITALLGLGALTVLSVQSELQSSGQSRFTNSALYAAESGTAAGMDFLRVNCSTTSLFSAWVTANNEDPVVPSGVIGNGVRPGELGNPFADNGEVANSDLWYEVTILNNAADEFLDDGLDGDGIVVIRSEGHGPDNTVAIVELEVMNDECVAKFCEQEYAQRGLTSRNDAYAACSPRIGGKSMRTFTP
jgi:hypothetical protein